MKQKKVLSFLFSVLISFFAAEASTGVTPGDVAGKQIELCMVGDSITWWNRGDYFRYYALKALPQLAFIGTHTGRLGYSHAGEGGDNLRALKQRINNRTRVPDARYYHLLMGVNDSAVSRKDADVKKNAVRIAGMIREHVRSLLARSCTEKVFVGTIFPCVSDLYPREKPHIRERFRLRDLTASAVNVIIRKEVPAEFGARVVIIDYEKILRARKDWKKIIRLHPCEEGYALVGPILAEAVRKHAKPQTHSFRKFGVEVTNLWDVRKNATASLLQGWYLMSFDVREVADGCISFTIRSKDNPRSKAKPYVRTVRIPARPGDRLTVEFQSQKSRLMQFEIKDVKGKIDRILVEKMRPSKKASVYGVGTYVDAASPMNLGEKFVPVK